MKLRYTATYFFFVINTVIMDLHLYTRSVSSVTGLNVNDVYKIVKNAYGIISSVFN